MAELVKPGGSARLAGSLSPEQLAILTRECPKVELRWGDIRTRLKASAKTGSRIDNARARFRPTPQGNQPTTLAEIFPEHSAPGTGALSEVPGASGVDALVEDAG